VLAKRSMQVLESVLNNALVNKKLLNGSNKSLREMYIEKIKRKTIK